MCKVIIAGNQKGGVAKTTTVANLGIGLARHGRRVLLIDGDAQGSLTASLGYPRPDEIDCTLATVLGKNTRAAANIWKMNFVRAFRPKRSSMTPSGSRMQSGARSFRVSREGFCPKCPANR